MFNVRSISKDITMTIYNMSNVIFMSMNVGIIVKVTRVKIKILNTHQTRVLGLLQGVLTK